MLHHWPFFLFPARFGGKGWYHYRVAKRSRPPAVWDWGARSAMKQATRIDSLTRAMRRDWLASAKSACHRRYSAHAVFTYAGYVFHYYYYFNIPVSKEVRLDSSRIRNSLGGGVSLWKPVLSIQPSAPLVHYNLERLEAAVGLHLPSPSRVQRQRSEAQDSQGWPNILVTVVQRSDLHRAVSGSRAKWSGIKAAQKANPSCCRHFIETTWWKIKPEWTANKKILLSM